MYIKSIKRILEAYPDTLTADCLKPSDDYLIFAKCHDYDIICFMIPEGVPLEPGIVVRHDEGLLYRVEDVRWRTDGYETAHHLGAMSVNYTQLDAGSYPAGTGWNKDEEGFRAHFTIEPVVDGIQAGA